MENFPIEDPKDEQITNKDESVTNKDGDTYLEKGKQPTDQIRAEDVPVPAETPGDNSGDPAPPATDEQNKDAKEENN